ncbi:hypothetical protein ACFQ2M_37300 [Kitasatospora saccharophila]|uniref:hypothetical protein n=1 Tax=Kitasatospora saccharophila TaxID=407973 RepID=UPI00363CB017
MHQDQGNGWTATGLRWQDGAPRLTATDGRERHARPLADGTPVAWRIAGPRRCTGARTERGHRPCPHRATVPAEGTTSQCPPCQNADRGLQLARDRILDDGREYRLYLAWFAPGLLKVGLTAVERGTARLLEQAALAWTFVARGPLPVVRRAELALAHARLARERIPAAAKYPAWWNLPAPRSGTTRSPPPAPAPTACSPTRATTGWNCSPTTPSPTRSSSTASPTAPPTTTSRSRPSPTEPGWPAGCADRSAGTSSSTAPTAPRCCSTPACSPAGPCTPTPPPPPATAWPCSPGPAPPPNRTPCSEPPRARPSRPALPPGPSARPAPGPRCGP